jgi:predicted PhzF superfamily epimerase YddE/YHI9
VLGREGRVHITRDDDGRLWTGGQAITCVSGEVRFG